MRRFLRYVGRSLRRRCPRCGSPGIFTGWFAMVRDCPGCGMRFEREEGYWTGAIAVNLIVTESVFVAALVIGALATWPDVPWITLMMGGAALNASVPVGFYPFSKLIWISLDLALHPLEDIEAMEADLRRS